MFQGNVGVASLDREQCQAYVQKKHDHRELGHWIVVTQKVTVSYPGGLDVQLHGFDVITAAVGDIQWICRRML